MLKTEGICWKKSGKYILRDIDFELSPGECVGLVGPNGSGKSSLLKLLAFLALPTSGSMWFKGQLISGKAPLTVRRQIAIVFQEPLLLNSTVYDNVAVGLKIRKVPQALIGPRVESWLEQFGIAHLKQQTARSLSGGEAQRVSLARAFVLEPEVLFLDEPFSALDAPIKKSLFSDLTRIFKQTKVTSVLVSHDFNDIQRMAERALILIDGEIKASGRPADLLRANLTKQASDFMSHWRQCKEFAQNS